MRSNVSGASSMGGTGELFRPVHTTPDPLTGRYADGRITPNHGYTRYVMYFTVCTYGLYDYIVLFKI